MLGERVDEIGRGNVSFVERQPYAFLYPFAIVAADWLFQADRIQRATRTLSGARSSNLAPAVWLLSCSRRCCTQPSRSRALNG
jgi:hypothetical protein